MKILHTADLHIGCLRDLPDYLLRQEAGFREIISIAEENKVDVLLIAGDLHDRSPKEEERNLIFSCISDALKRNPKLVIIIMEGNHDWNTQDISMLEGLALAYSPVGTRIHIIRSEPSVVSIKDSHFICIPCRQNVTKSWLKKKVKSMIRNLDGDIYVALHEAMKSYTDGGREVGKESIPKIPRVKAWMLGDIHKHQFLAKNAWYCGSPMQTSFGEKPNKGVVIVEDGKPTFIKLKKPKKLLTIEQGQEAPPNTIVKVKITDPLNFDRASVADNVVAFEQDIRESAKVDLEGLSVLTDGLPKILAEKFGYSKKMQKKSIKYIESLVDK